jgi:hypothetical protein
VTATTVAVLSRTGRWRWKIENEGFNIQKHQGYAWQHKYARVNWQAAKILLSMPTNRPFDQSVDDPEHGLSAPAPGQNHPLPYLWQTMMAFLLYGHLRRSTLKQLTQRRFQMRFT